MAKTDFRLPEHRIAFFVSHHGFGHAARSASIMSALKVILPSIQFEVFTQTPAWFFKNSLTTPFSYNSCLTDIGLVQRTPLLEDLPKTVDLLDDFLPFDSVAIANLSRKVAEKKCDLIVCDIAPIGIKIAEKIGIPSVLIENFTWDWIYQGYETRYPKLGKPISYLQKLFDSADYHIQAEPVCRSRNVDLCVNPVSRSVRTPAGRVRKALGIPNDKKLVVITMGGIPEKYDSLAQLRKERKIHFVVPGGNDCLSVQDNIILLPYKSDFFHPDLINASDAVIGKVGYSTLSEIYHAGVPFGYISRPDFRESEILAAYIDKHMNGISLTDGEYQSGGWISRLSELLVLPRVRRSDPNGANQAASFLRGLLSELT